MICYGYNPVMEALHCPKPPKGIYLQEGKDNPRIRAALRKADRMGIPVREVVSLERVVGSPDHQGIGMEIADPWMEELPDEVVQNGTRFVIFDSIRDPHNFGAALRVCDVFGFHNIVYFKGNSSGVTSTVVKVSAGAIFHVNIYMSNLNTAIKRLQEAGVMVVVLEAGGDKNIFEMELPERCAVVIGSEGEGVRFNIRRMADQIVEIPMQGHVNSLNVSCALTAALTQFSHRMGPPAAP